MKRPLLILAIAVAVIAAATGYWVYDRANRDFTPWQTEPSLAAFLQKFESPIPGERAWKETHWITAAEGRWHDGVAEYRIRYEEAPKNTPFVWNWYINMDQATFSKNIQDFLAKGFVLVYHSSYKLPDGTRRYQGVWHKLGSTS